MEIMKVGHLVGLLIMKLGLSLDSLTTMKHFQPLVFGHLGRAVAQSGSALRWGCRGREFKSHRPDQFFTSLSPKKKGFQILTIC
jgi:hypothetical protein